MDSLIQFELNNIYEDIPNCGYTLRYNDLNSYTEMGDGSTMCDVVGSKAVLDFSWEYIPQELLTKIANQRRISPFINVKYRNENGIEITEEFLFPPIAATVFKILPNGTPVWCDINLHIEATEVGDYS